MINGSDTEIPFQWVSSCWDPSAILGCIEIQDSLPAGATQTYTLEAGPPAATVTNPIVVSNGVPCYGGGGATCIQITNGRTGLQVPTVASNNAAAAYRQAPIQGIMLPNGQWTGAYNGAGPNIIYAENPTGVVSLSLASPITTATGYRAKFLQYGPMKTVLQLAYQFNRPNYMTTNGYFFNVSCNPATNSISFGGGVVPAGATVLFSSNNFCPVAGGSAPLDSQHYYVATAVPGSSTNYTLTTSGIPVNITGSITTSTRAVFVLNSTTGCAAGCLNSSPGRLIVTFTIYANSRAILVTEDSDMEHSEYYPFYNEVAPDTARFRNNLGNGSADPRCGYQTPIAVTAVGSANGTATITLGGGNTASNGELIYLTGVGSGSTLPNGIYYLQTTSPFSATSPGVWTSGSLTGATSPPASYSGSGLVKLPTYQLQQQNSQDWGFDMPWVYDSSFSYAEPILNAGTGCSLSGGHLYSTSPLEVNYPVSEYNAVWSWQNYQVNGSSTSPVLGWFSGDAGLMQNAKYGSMPGLLAADNNGGPNTSIQNSNFVNTNLSQNIDNFGVQKSWGIWVGTNADLPPFGASTHPQIQDDMNSLTGVNLSHIYAYRAAAYATPPGGWQWLYMANSNATVAGQEMACLIARVRDGSSTCAGLFPDGRTAQNCSSTSGSACYYNLLYYNSITDNTSRAVLNMWQSEASSPSTAVGTAITNSGCLPKLAALGTVLAAGDNHFNGAYNYYQVDLIAGEPCFALWNAILADPNATSAQKASMATMAGLLGGLLWDDSWFAWDGSYIDNYGNLQNISGVGAGLQNQQVMFAQDRASLAYQYGNANAFLATKLPASQSASITQLHQSIGCNGAVQGGTHYQLTYDSALVPNSQITALQGTQSFANNCQWQGLANWYLSTMTPPDPRYGNLRKKYATGDTTAEEADPYPGLLATALYSSNPSTAGWMSWLWHGYGNSTFQYHGTLSLFQIDETIPQIVPPLTSQQIDGYHSVHRFGSLGGGRETSLWFINGGNPATQPVYYSTQGHRHYDDGQVTIFALGAPLAMDWGANLYFPETPDRFEHNSITFDQELTAVGGTWSMNNPQFQTYGMELLASPTVMHFQAFTGSTYSTATFTYSPTQDTGGDNTVWTRAVRTMAPDSNYPILYIKDTFSGGSGGGKTLTWNLEALGPVTAPSTSGGTMTITPVTSFRNGCNASGALPSANDNTGLAPYALANGLQKFVFTGFTWPQYSGGSLKWNLYQRPTSGSAQFLIGNWGHGCGVGFEQGEFQAANTGASWYGSSANACNSGNNTGFCDWQHILRVHDTGPFETVMTPTVASGSQPVVNYANGLYTATFGSSESLSWNDSVAMFSSGTTQALTVYDSSTQSAFGFTLSGGPQEVVNNGAGTITWTIDDVSPGTRTLTLPAGTWYPSVPVQQNAGTYTYYHVGGAEPVPATITFTQTPGTLRSVPLNYDAPPGAAQIRVKFGSTATYTAIASCTPLCSIVMQTPVGTWPEQHDFLDGNGNIVASSANRNMVIQ